MTESPISEEIIAALARFFYAGHGPSHATITRVATASGYGDDAPYNPTSQTPNKQVRTQAVLRAALRRPQRAREVIDRFLAELRVHGCFDQERPTYDGESIRAAQSAFRRAGWILSNGGVVRPIGAIDVTTGGRPALDEQLARLRRSTEDPGQLLGSAKDLLEAVAKFVLEEVGVGAPTNASFSHLWYLARDRLGILPQQVADDLPGVRHIKAILQSAWTIAEQVNELRGLQGTGHGRTLPTGVTPEMALVVVREACAVAEFTLSTLDRQRGR